MSEHAREIPASLMDLPRLEQYFEEQAERGLMLDRIGGFWASGNAIFEDIVGTPYHFCVRPFENGDLQQLKAGFEDCGWTLTCTHGSLVVFHSKEAQRPPVPAGVREKLHSLLLKQVCREERRLLLALQIFIMIIELPLFYIIFSRPFLGTAVVGGAVLTVMYLIFTLSVQLGQWLRHFQALHCLKAGGNSPEQIPFWNKSAQMSLGLSGVALAFIYYSWLLGDEKHFLLAAGFLLTCAANIAVCAVWHKNTGLHRWKFIPWLLSPVIALLLFWCVSRL